MVLEFEVELMLSLEKEKEIELGLVSEIEVESDPEEGTRIELHFKYSSESRYNPLQHLAVISK